MYRAFDDLLLLMAGQGVDLHTCVRSAYGSLRPLLIRLLTQPVGQLVTELDLLAPLPELGGLLRGQRLPALRTLTLAIREGVMPELYMEAFFLASELLPHLERLELRCALAPGDRELLTGAHGAKLSIVR